MAAAGLSIDDGLIQPGDFSFESGEAAMRAWLALAEPVTAAIASSEQMALGALHVARDRGVDVPDELSLVSFDDTPVVRFSVPPLTAITQPIASSDEPSGRDRVCQYVSISLAAVSLKHTQL